MTTIRKELSTLREILEEVTDDSNFQESLLYDVWNKARVTVLKNEISKSGLLSPWNKMRFCIDLEKVKSHNCDCVAGLGCDVLKTVYEVPQPVSGFYTGAIEVFTIYGERIGYSDEPSIRSDQLDPIKAGKRRWSLYNRKIIIWNDPELQLPTIQVNGVWEDILDWEEIQTCPDSEVCPSIFDKELGVNQHHARQILTLAVETFKPKLELVDDQTQDRNPERRV